MSQSADSSSRFSVKEAFSSRAGAVFIVGILAYIFFGAALFLRSLPEQPFTEAAFIIDQIWLDAWALAFFVMLLSLWFMPRLPRYLRVRWSVGAFSFFGFVAVAVMFGGTDLGWNGYLGDQQFRIAMIMRYMQDLWPMDMYYRGLPTFYPPVLYWLLARLGELLGQPAFAMPKISSLCIFLIWPLVLFVMWRRLLTALQAGSVVLFTFLIAMWQNPMPLTVPHAFLSNTLFVPWWLYFIERVRSPEPTRGHYLAGGLIGGLLFMTYYFPFFLGGLLLLIRLATGERRVFHWRHAFLILGLAALFSAPYWAPLLVSVVQLGFDSAQQRWHHLGVTGVGLTFYEWSLAGIVYLAGVLYAFRQLRMKLYSSLLFLIGSVVAFLLIGSVLGALDRPVNLVKAREFVVLLGGPVVGLPVAALLRLRMVTGRFGRITAGLVMVLLLAFLNAFIQTGKASEVRVARNETAPPAWLAEVKVADVDQIPVVISAANELPAFEPAYLFVALNEHYTHPAAQFSDRVDFLTLLQQSPSPDIFHLVLGANRFDSVDCFYLPEQGDDYLLRINTSNYPDRFYTKTLRFPSSLFTDTSLFEIPTDGGIIRRLGSGYGEFDQAERGVDRHTTDLWAAEVMRYLTPEGRAQLTRYVGLDTMGWVPILDNEDDFAFNDTLTLTRLVAQPDGDSMDVLYTFEVHADMERDFRIFLHVFDSAWTKYNWDFAAPTPTSTWRRGDIVLAVRRVAMPSDLMQIRTGFFKRPEAFGQGFDDWVIISERRSGPN